MSKLICFNLILFPKKMSNIGKHAQNIHIKQNPPKEKSNLEVFPSKHKNCIPLFVLYIVRPSCKCGNLNPNNKVTGEFFMSDIFRPTNFWRGKFYISKENPFVWEIFCWTNVKLWNKYLLPKNSHGVKGAEFKSFIVSWLIFLNHPFSQNGVASLHLFNFWGLSVSKGIALNILTPN